ncbi:unnamed protein product [Caenorhabditis brenneri]
MLDLDHYSDKLRERWSRKNTSDTLTFECNDVRFGAFFLELDKYMKQLIYAIGIDSKNLLKLAVYRFLRPASRQSNDMKTSVKNYADQVESLLVHSKMLQPHN